MSPTDKQSESELLSRIMDPEIHSNIEIPVLDTAYEVIDPTEAMEMLRQGNPIRIDSSGISVLKMNSHSHNTD